MWADNMWSKTLISNTYVIKLILFNNWELTEATSFEQFCDWPPSWPYSLPGGATAYGKFPNIFTQHLCIYIQYLTLWNDIFHMQQSLYSSGTLIIPDHHWSHIFLIIEGLYQCRDDWKITYNYLGNSMYSLEII